MPQVPFTGNTDWKACLTRIMDVAWFGADITGRAKPPDLANTETVDCINAAGTATVGVIGLNASNVTIMPNANGVLCSGTFTTSGMQVQYSVSNYIGTETGANNAIAAALLDASGAAVPLAAGLKVTIKLAHTLQAGANTLALNGGTAKNIKSHYNTANNIATVYASGALFTATYDGTQWQDISQ